MSGILIALGFAVFFHFLIHMGRREVCEELYEDCVNDVESRLDWGHSRQLQPPGMETQMNNAKELLDEAKALWEGSWFWEFDLDKNKSRWYRAMRLAVQARKAMNEAQDIFIRGNNNAQATSQPWFVSEQNA